MDTVLLEQNVCKYSFETLLDHTNKNLPLC
jgi:hypothetical protein